MWERLRRNIEYFYVTAIFSCLINEKDRKLLDNNNLYVIE